MPDRSFDSSLGREDYNTSNELGPKMGVSWRISSDETVFCNLSDLAIPLVSLWVDSGAVASPSHLIFASAYEQQAVFSHSSVFFRFRQKRTSALGQTFF